MFNLIRNLYNFHNFTKYVLNNTRVIPARLYGHKLTGGKFECLIERILDGNRALVQLRCSKSPKAGAQLIFPEGLSVEVIGRRGELFELCFPMNIDKFKGAREAQEFQDSARNR